MKKLIILLSLISLIGYGQEPEVDQLYIRPDGFVWFDGVAFKPECLDVNCDTAFVVIGSDTVYIKGVVDEFSFIDLDTANANPATRKGRIYWDTTLNVAKLDMNNEVTLNLGRELFVYGTNTSSRDMVSGDVVYIGPANSSGFAQLKLSIADNISTSEATVAVVTENIPVGEQGHATRFGAVNMDLTGFGSTDLCFLSDVDSGLVIPTAPMSPNYKVPVGRVIKAGVNGILGVDVRGFSDTDTEVNIEGMLNGFATYKPEIYDTVIGGLLYVDIENADYPNKNLPYMYNGDRYLLNTTTGSGKNGRARVQLSYGTQTAPLYQYVYIDHNGGSPQLAVSTTAYPEDAIRIAVYGVRTQFKHEAESFAYVRRSNNAVNGSNANGVLNKIVKRIRRDGSGLDNANFPVPTVDIVTSAGLDTIKVSTTSGIGYQLNDQIVNAMSSPIVWLNPPSGGDSIINSLSEIGVKADGGSFRLNNARARFNIFVVIRSGGYGSYLAVNVSKGTYASDADCISDIGNNSITTPPIGLRDICVRYIAIPVRYTTANGGTFTNLLGAGGYQSEINFPFGFGGVGGATSGGVSYPQSDAVWSLSNNADPTKLGNISLANVTTGTTSTQTWPATSGSLAQKKDSTLFGSAFTDDTLQVNIDAKATNTANTNEVLLSDGAGNGQGYSNILLDPTKVTFKYFDLDGLYLYDDTYGSLDFSDDGNGTRITSFSGYNTTLMADNGDIRNVTTFNNKWYVYNTADTLIRVDTNAIKFFKPIISPSNDTLNNIIKVNQDTSKLIIEGDEFLVLKDYASGGGFSETQIKTFATDTTEEHGFVSLQADTGTFNATISPKMVSSTSSTDYYGVENTGVVFRFGNVEYMKLFPYATGTNYAYTLNTTETIDSILKVLADDVLRMRVTSSGGDLFGTWNYNGVEIGTGSGGAMTAQAINDSAKIQGVITKVDTITFEYLSNLADTINLYSDRTLFFDTTNMYMSFDYATKAEAVIYVIGRGNTDANLTITHNTGQSDYFTNAWDTATTQEFYLTKFVAQMVKVSDIYTLGLHREGNYIFLSNLDTVAPIALTHVVESANKDSLIVTYDKQVTGTTGAGSGGFTVTGYGNPTVSNVDISGATVGLKLSSVVDFDSVYTVSYDSLNGDIASTNNVKVVSYTDSSVVLNEVLPTDYVVYYPFSGNANDESGNGYNLTVSGASLATDRHGTANSCYLFSSATDVLYATSTGLALNDTFSISWWSYQNSVGSTDYHFSLVSTGSSEKIDYFYNNKWVTQIRDASSQRLQLGYTDASATAWHHNIMEVTTDTIRYYIDNSLQSVVSVVVNEGASLVETTGFNIYIANASSTSSFAYEGYLDDFRIYNRVLSDVEKQSLKDE